MDRAHDESITEIVRRRGTRVAVAAGEPLFLEGDRPDGVYAVSDGRVRIVCTLSSGAELLLGIKGIGDVFGELSALDGRPRSAAAFAHDDTVVSKLSPKPFIDALEETPHLAISLMRGLSADLRRANLRLMARNNDSARTRTGHLLLELCDLMRRHGDVAPGEPVEIPLRQRDVAEWIGATRESTSRALAEFRRAGLVATERGRIVVRDVDGLIAAVDV